MPKITVIGLGPAEGGLLTVEALKAIKESRYLFLRTSVHPTVAFLEKEGIKFESFDHIYQESQQFEEVYQRIAKELMTLAADHGEITYAVPGHPLVGEKTTLHLIEFCKEAGIELEIRPALSFLDVVYSSLLVDPLEGMETVDALRISEQALSTSLGLIVTQVYSRLIASDVKLHLLQRYPSDWPVTIVRCAGSTVGKTSISKVPLAELDHHKNFDHLTSLFLPALDVSEKTGFEGLLEIMAKLRGPSGCPWDREQTHASLKRHLIEETHEVIDTIDREDWEHLSEELGDLLLQIVFHAQIAAEEGEFAIDDVLSGITSKLIRRHPHIFGEEEAETPDDVIVHWERIKRDEGKTKLLAGIPQSLPALLHAYKIQKKAARVGFDWEVHTDVLEKLDEEVEELKQACFSADQDHLEEEIGDVLFTVVNLARHFEIEPESALKRTLKKFKNRFEHIEEEAEKRGVHLSDMSLQEKETLWQKAKESEKT